MNLHLLNWWAVAVAALMYMGAGLYQYGPLLGRQWTTHTLVRGVVGGVLAGACMAAVLSYASRYFAAVTVIDALVLAFWMWLGFVAVVQAGAYVWEGKPVLQFVFNAVYMLALVCLMSLVLVLWR